MWHQSRSNPLKVYDALHNVACIAESPELARFIIAAANQAIRAGATVPLQLREPLAQPEPVTQDVTNVVDEDSCCASRLGNALRRGAIPNDTWVCPQCGCEWHGKMMPESSVRRWSPVVDVSVMPGRA